jgi:hypothetical protein
MRKLLIVAIAATMAMMTGQAHANGQRVRAQASSGPGLFNRLVEFERRKNAALRVIVLGR